MPGLAGVCTPGLLCGLLCGGERGRFPGGGGGQAVVWAWSALFGRER